MKKTSKKQGGRQDRHRDRPQGRHPDRQDRRDNENRHNKRDFPGKARKGRHDKEGRKEARHRGVGRENDRPVRGVKPRRESSKEKPRPAERPRFEKPAREAPDRKRADITRTPRRHLKVSLWGVHACREALLNPDRTVGSIYLTEAAKGEFFPILAQAQARGLNRPEPEIVEKTDLDRSLPRETVHQGVALNADPLPEVFVQDLIAGAAIKQRAVFLMLDQVTDPHNIGAVLRSACAFGALGVVMQRRHAPELEGVATKTASGAAEHIPVAYETNLSRTIELFQDAGYTVIGLDERGEKTIAQAGGHDRVVLVLGAEGAGLRHLVAGHCDVLARLPTSGPVGSLNVSNAAAVALYAVLEPMTGG